MSKMQRTKGAAGERELAELLRSIGIYAQRSARNGVDRAEDILHNIPGVHIECKRVESLNISKAMQQASTAAGKRIPTVWHRRSREKWLVTIPAADIETFACALVAAIDANSSALGERGATQMGKAEDLPFGDKPEPLP